MEKISGKFSFVAEEDKIEAEISGTDVINVLAKYAGKNIVVTIEETE